MKIKVKEITPGCKFESIKKGNWIDLRAATDVEFEAPRALTLKRSKVNNELIGHRSVNIEHKFIPLGIAMELPKGYEAIIAPRSSTFLKYGAIMWNSIGVIDTSYCGDNDQWNFGAIFLNKVKSIKKGDRICQFRIQLSQNATIWQKIKWIFTNKIKFEWVESLNNEDRGGFGITGSK